MAMTMPRTIKPYRHAIVRRVEAATVLALGEIATTIAALPPEERAEAYGDAERSLAEQFGLLGRGREFVNVWAELSMTALRLLVAAQDRSAQIAELGDQPAEVELVWTGTDAVGDQCL
jgi:hypothetical protein